MNSIQFSSGFDLLRCKPRGWQTRADLATMTSLGFLDGLCSNKTAIPEYPLMQTGADHYEPTMGRIDPYIMIEPGHDARQKEDDAAPLLTVAG